jgi:hypothetical protein
VTTEQTTRVVPAGWYQDPADTAKVRWWNGITWTEHVETKPADQQAGLAGALAIEGGPSSGTGSSTITPEQRAAEARELERQYGISTDGSAGAETDIMSRRASMQLDSRGPSTGTIPIQGVAAPHKANPGTASAWLLAMTPLFALVLAGIAGYVYFYVTPTPLVLAIGAVLWILGLLWAVGDSRALETRGLPHPSPLWSLALPVIGPILYLLVRRGRVAGSGPLVVSIAMLALVGAAIGGVVSPAGATLTKALEVQQAVRADLVGSGAAAGVTCPPLLETVIVGTVFTCDATLASGDIVHVWVSIDNELGQFSWALANR